MIRVGHYPWRTSMLNRKTYARLFVFHIKQSVQPRLATQGINYNHPQMVNIRNVQDLFPALGMVYSRMVRIQTSLDFHALSTSSQR